jgi:hypothetical protein
MASSPFYYGMPNFTSQFSTAILAAGHNASIGLGGTTPPYTPFPFGGSHIPQTNPNIGSVLALNTRSNPFMAGWNNQPGIQVSSYIPTSSALILTNTFGMTNPLQSYGFPLEGGQSYPLGNPQPRSNPVGGNFHNPQPRSYSAGGNFYNPQQNIPVGMTPDPLYMNQPGDPRQKTRPHADGIAGSTNVKSTDSTMSHLKNLSLNQSTGGPTSSVSSNPTQSTDVHSVQSSKNRNGGQQPGRNKRKGRNNHKGGKNGSKPKDKDNNGKSNDNAKEGKKEKHKVKFPCKLCTDDHLTHLCPKLTEAVRLLKPPSAVLTNPFPRNQHLASRSSNTENATGRRENPPSQDGNHACIKMVNAKIDIATRSRDYSSSQANSGLEAPPPPPETNLQIQKPEPPLCIPKGVLKHSTHNPNARSTHNYSIVEDLGQTRCTMSTLEVL